MVSTPGEDAVKTVEVTTKDSEYYTNSFDEATARFDRTDSDFERSSVGKCCQTALQATEKPSVKGRVNRCSRPDFCLKELPQLLQPSAATTLISQQPSI